jgi:iron complex outermembrane receptor protein
LTRGQDIPSGKNEAGGKPEAVLFEPLPVVEAASLHSQSLVEAPASVTVVTAEEIQRRGYRTLADVLADVRGMYVSYDRTYHYVGVRGFSLASDNNTRFLFMVNGHSLTENVLDSANYFGQDFGLDLELVERIEIVRGPSSALYGSNGMFATINIVTKSPVEYEPFRVAVETDTFGERKVHLSTSQYLGHGANLLFSTSIFNNTGQSLYFPEFDTPLTNNGWAERMDGERGYHSFANLIWRGWSFLAYFNSREKIVPTGLYGTLFNDRGTKLSDARSFVEAAYQKNVGAEGQLRWRTYYDGYRFLGRYEFQDVTSVGTGWNVAKGDWVGTQLTYRFPVPHIGFLTVGSEASWDLRALMTAYYGSPENWTLARVDRPNRSFAAFLQDEWQLSRRWTLYLGGRLDTSRNHELLLTPRVALIYQPSSATVVKLLYGRAFRDPSPFEQFYDDGVSQIANPDLQAERMQTLEAAFEKKLGKKFELQANVYRYRIGGLIAAALTGGLIQQYRNVEAVRSTGFELEGTGKLGSRLKIDASLAVERSADNTTAYARVNSPARVGKVLLETPVFGDRWSLSGGFQYLSKRNTFAGDVVPAVYLVNLTAASRRLPGGLELQVGVRNLFNYRYWDPAGTVQVVDRIQQDGRCLFLRLSWAAHRSTEGAAAQGKPWREP